MPVDTGGARVREWRPPWELDLLGTLSPHRRGHRDPAFRVEPDGSVWRASYTPDGPGTLRLRLTGDVVEAMGWG
ncbi:DNA-3-methyladenine glycosylase 2 family protein, partial [Actinomadura sp. GC306]